MILGLALLAPRRSAAQAGGPGAVPICPDGTIAAVRVVNHSIFDPDDLAGESRFRWAYGLANSLHVRTREGFIRSELLFAEGDCYDPLLLRESERLLRDYRFIARVTVVGTRGADGRWTVAVETQDEWTTRPALGIAPGNEPWLRAATLTEESLFGRGILVSARFRDRGGDHEYGARVALPRTLGTRTDTRLGWGRTGYGDFLDEEISYPFLGQVGRFAARQAFHRMDAAFLYSVGAGRDLEREELVHVLLPIAAERFELTLAGRIGSPGNLTVLGMGFSNETLHFSSFPGGMEVERAGVFGRHPATDPRVADAVRHQTLHSAGTHVNFLVGQRNIRFERFRGLDALRGVQDVPLGSSFSLTIGRSVAALSAGTDQPDDMSARLGMELSSTVGPQVLVLTTVGVEARQITSGVATVTADGWSDVLAEGAALLYWQPRALPSHTFLARAVGSGGWSVTQPFQLTLGGPAGVRGYHPDDFPGGRQVVLTAEDRLYLGWPFPRLLDLGATVMADLGRMWAGDAPFGVNSGWQASVGGGLRVSFPAGSGGVARADVMWPVTGGGGLGRPLLRVSMIDPIGIAAGLANRQLARSRRLQIGPDLFTEHLR